MKVKRLPVRVTENDLKKLDFICKCEELSRSEVVRLLIDRSYAIKKELTV